VLKVTRYDRVSSFLMATAFGLLLSAVWLGVLYLQNRITDTDAQAELELLDLGGGSLDGVENETLELESPEEVSNDPSLEDTPEETEVEETIDNVMELAETAAQQAQQQFDTAVEDTGKRGSATGTGHRALGQGPGTHGMPREQRLFVRFSDTGFLGDYARQLDYFGIVLGLLQDGKLYYLSKLSRPKPAKQVRTSGAGEKRLYMIWQGGNRRKADIKLLAKAGLKVGRGDIIFHFYPRRTELLLARKEQSYARRPVSQIRRTYFVVRRKGSAYEFVVTRQRYFR